MTTEATPEAAMRRACDAILAGDIYGAMADLTPEAVNEAMGLAAGITTVPMPQSYELDSHEVLNGDHRYGVVFQTSGPELRAQATWRLVDGAWKIVSIGVIGL